MAEKPAAVIDTDSAKENQEHSHVGPFIMRRTIRSTAYEVVVHFSQTSRETLKDKILRMINNEMRHKQSGRRFSNATGEDRQMASEE